MLKAEHCLPVRLVRGHIQTICEKISVIMALSPHPPPPPPPLASVIQNNHLNEGRKASEHYSPQGLNPYHTFTFFYSSVVST